MVRWFQKPTSTEHKENKYKQALHNDDYKRPRKLKYNNFINDSVQKYSCLDLNSLKYIYIYIYL